MKLPKGVTWRQLAEEAARRGVRIRNGRREGTVKKLSFVEWVKRVRPSFNWSRHNVALGRVLQQVAEKKITRLMVFMPPRHGKSELTSRLFTAYWLYLYPHEEVGLASYGASLAEQLSADARGNYLQCGRSLDPSTKSKSDWRTREGGRMWAEGVGGALTGKGFHLGVIDDPFKGAEDSNSETQRRKVKEWYQSVFYTRQAPEASIVLLNTRWHQDDLTGWQLAEEWAASRDEEGEPERWHIVDLSAVRDLDEERTYPPTCTVEPDWRRHGEALDPSRYPIQKLNRLRKRVGDYWWAALYQQTPTVKEGGIFEPRWFHRLHSSQIPVMLKTVLGVDLAVTEKDENDFTVAFPIGVDSMGRYYVFRPFRAQVGSPETIRAVTARAIEVGATCIGVESVAYQLSVVQHLRERPELAGRPILPVPADRDKVARAKGWSPLPEQGLVTLVTDGTGWEETFLTECRDFPRGKWKDQVDAVGIAFAALAQSGQFTAAAGGEKVGELLAGLR